MNLLAEQSALARICTDMTRRGIVLDMDRLQEVRGLLADDKNGLETKLGFNPRSHKQIKAFFLEKGVLLPNTGFETMEKYADRYPAIPELQDIVDFKSLGKGDEAWYGAEYIGLDNRLHPRWNPTGTVERRLSCSRPNFQNVPHRSKGGDSTFAKMIRSVVVPEPGHLLAELDASSGEDWSTAFDMWKRTGDKTLLDILATKVDFHSHTAEHIQRICFFRSVKVQKMSSKSNPEMYIMRDTGKRVNHSHKYGEGFKYAAKGSQAQYKLDKSLHSGLAVFGWEGNDYIVGFGAYRLAELIFNGDASFDNQRKAILVKKQLMNDYPGILEWQRVVFETWRRTGFVRNPFGFGRPLYGEPAECAKRGFAFLGASTLQSIVIRGMIDVVHELKPKLHAQIHDSLLPSVQDEEEVKRMIPLMERDRDGLVVPWEYSIGKNWSEM